RNVSFFRIDRLLLASVSLRRSRIEHGLAFEPHHVLVVEDPGSIQGRRGEVARWDMCLAALERAGPGLDATVQHRLLAMAEPAKQVQEPRRDRTARVVIDDHPHRIVDAGPSHGRLELFARGQRVTAMALTGHIVQVDEYRAGNVSGTVLIGAP